MQTRLREEYDADRRETDLKAASEKTKYAPNEMRCNSCGELFYVDDLTFESINRAIREGLDNPFICPNCEQEYEELSHN